MCNLSPRKLGDLGPPMTKLTFSTYFTLTETAHWTTSDPQTLLVVEPKTQWAHFVYYPRDPGQVVCPLWFFLETEG